MKNIGKSVKGRYKNGYKKKNKKIQCRKKVLKKAKKD